MIQKAAIAVLLAMALAMPAAAAPPLPPGRPAGGRIAQLTQKQMIFVGVGVLAAATGLYLASGEYKIAGGDSTTPPVTPPDTTPTTATH